MGDIKNKKSLVPFLRQCFVTASVSLNIVGHGAVIGFSAILIPSLRTPESHIHATPAEESSIASIVGIALIVGNFIITPLLSFVGRKTAHMLTIFPILTGWFVLVLSESVIELIIGRFLQGISMGMLGPLGSIIVAEMTEPKNRGAFLTCVSLSLTLGVLFGHTIGTYIAWQQVALISSFITFSSLILIIFCPESPPWLISQGRFEEADQIFHWLRGQDEEHERELESMITAKKMARKSSVLGQQLSIRIRINRFFRYLNETFRKPEFFKPILIMFFLYVMFQFAGINVISSYALDIISQVVGPEANSKMLMVAMDVNRLICNVFAVYLMRTFKRRTVLFCSGTVCILGYLAKGAFVYAKQSGQLPPVLEGQWLPILLLSIYMSSLTLGISSVPFAISGEIFPLEYRGLAGGISVLPLSLNFFIAVKCFPVLTAAIGLPMTYLLYAFVVLICLVFIFFLLPETKDRTLQDIEDTFRGLDPRDRKSVRPLQPKEGTELMRRCSSHILY